MTDSDTPLLQLSQASKSFGKQTILSQIDLTVNFKDRICIIGPSGAGKSTLIRILNQLTEHDDGSLLYKGKKISSSSKDLQTLRTHVGMVFQQFNLFPHMTAIENCLSPLQTVKKLKREEALSIAHKYLALVHLQDHSHKYPSELSGGQQQRVAIARAMCMEPDVMLFDEPTSALDPEMTQEVLSVIINIAHAGTTMVCVTHEMDFAKKIATRIVFIDQGKIIEDTPTAEFFSSPKTDRAKLFLSKLGATH